MQSIKLVSEAISKPLKEAGFKKSGTKWNLAKSPLIFVASLQRASFSDDNYLGVRLNFGIGFPNYYSQVWEQKTPNFLSDAHCMLRFNFDEQVNRPFFSTGSFLAIESNSQRDAVIARLVISIEKAVKFFSGIDTPKDLLRYREIWTGEKQIYVGQLLMLVLLEREYGDKKIAHDLIAGLKAGKPRGAWADRVDDFEKMIVFEM